MLVVCPNCKMGQDVPMDYSTDRPKKGFTCSRCKSKIT